MWLLPPCRRLILLRGSLRYHERDIKYRASPGEGGESKVAQKRSKKTCQIRNRSTELRGDPTARFSGGTTAAPWGENTGDPGDMSSA